MKIEKQRVILIIDNYLYWLIINLTFNNIGNNITLYILIFKSNFKLVFIVEACLSFNQCGWN